MSKRKSLEELKHDEWQQQYFRRVREGRDPLTGAKRRSEHTPTPWIVYEGNAPSKDCPGIEAPDVMFSVVIWGDHEDPYDCCGVQGRTIEEARANARFIVRACNVHEELVEALKDVLAVLDHLAQSAVTKDGYAIRYSSDGPVGIARAALAKAREE